jgi:hypothetical protein
MNAEPIKDILNRYEGQDVFVVIEVLKANEKICEPITGRLIGVTPDEDEATRMCQGLKDAMVRWTGRLAEAIILYAHLSI